MPPRLPVGQAVSVERLTPQAAPVNTYTAPNAGAGLEQLSQALSTVAPEVGRFSDQMAAQRATSDKFAGQKLARELQESGLQYADAVKSGKIPASGSPWFRAGLQEQYGRVSADRYESDLMVHIAGNPDLQDSTDLNAYDQEEQKFRQDWLKDNVGPDNRTDFFEMGFGKLADAHLADLRRNWASQIGGKLEQQQDSQHFTEAYQIIEHGLDSDASHEDIGQALNFLTRDALTRNPKAGTSLNRRTAEAVIAVARARNDEGLLDILKSTEGGPGAKLYQVRGIAPMIEEAEGQIRSERQSKYNFAQNVEQDHKQQAVDGILREGFTRLEASNGDVSSVDMKDLRTRLGQIDPKAAESLYSLQDAFAKRVFDDNPLVAAGAFSDAYRGSLTLDKAMGYLNDRSISIPTFKNLAEIIQQTQANGGPNQKMLSEPGLTNGKKLVRSLFVSEFGFEGPEMRWRAGQAELEYEARYLQWRNSPEGKTPTPEQLNTFTDKNTNEIFRNLSTSQSFRDFSKIPKATTPSLGPVVPDWKTNMVTDPSNISQLDNEVSALQAHRISKLSQQTIFLLRWAKVDPTNANEIKDFIRTQKAMLPPPVVQPPDSQ